MEWRGDVPRRHWLSLPLWCPAGWRRGRSPANPAFSFPFAPYPPSPLPRWGRGRIKVFLCKGLRPLHPRGLLRAALARRASAVPCGGAQGMVVGSPCPPMFPAGACLSPRLPTLLLALFLPPIPQPPSPAGKGEIQSLFRRGLRPRHPCIRPFAAPTATAKRAPRGQNPRGTCYLCPGGEDHLKRRSSSPPVPPLLGYRHCQ